MMSQRKKTPKKKKTLGNLELAAKLQQATAEDDLKAARALVEVAFLRKPGFVSSDPERKRRAAQLLSFNIKEVRWLFRRGGSR